jgi:hypothetical protein
MRPPRSGARAGMAACMNRGRRPLAAPGRKGYTYETANSDTGAGGGRISDGLCACAGDGAVYLISNGQRRWVATVVISDEEIDRYPEGEPVYVGLAPMGSSTQASTGSGSSGSGASSTATRTTESSGSGSSSSSSSANRQATATPSEDLDDDLPVKVDIEGDEKFEAGDSFTVEVTTKPDAVCELVAKFPGGKEVSEDSKNADNRGKCKYTIEIPKNTKKGDGTLIGTVRDGGKVNKAEIAFEVVDGD